jgi:hypothetical protein
MLYLQHDLYNVIFKTKNKLYIASGSTPHSPRNILGAHLRCDNSDTLTLIIYLQNLRKQNVCL